MVGKYGGARNEAGNRIVEFAIAYHLAIVDTFFEKRITRRTIYISGGLHSQIDYILCRRENMRMVKDCLVLPKEAVTKQHKMVEVERNGTKGEVHENSELKQYQERPWEVLSSAMRKTAKETLGETSGKAEKKGES